MVDRPNLDAGSSSELHWPHRATSLQHFALRRMASWTFGLAQSADETRSETIGLVKRQAAKLKLRERDESISHLSFLFEEYEPRCYLFVVPDLFRKLCMTSLLVFIYPGSATQIATGLLIALISAKVYSYAAPYIEYSDDAVAELAQTQIVIIFFMCLMIFVTKKMEEQSGQPGDLFQGTVFSMVMVFFGICTVLLTVTAVTLELAGATPRELRDIAQKQLKSMTHRISVTTASMRRNHAQVHFSEPEAGEAAATSPRSSSIAESVAEATAALSRICAQAAEERRQGRGAVVTVGGVPLETKILLRALRMPKYASAICLESVSASAAPRPDAPRSSMSTLCDIALLSFKPDFTDASWDADSEARRVTRILVELARLAAASGAGHSAVVNSLCTLGCPEHGPWEVVRRRLDDSAEHLGAAGEEPSWRLAYGLACVDLLATVTARPLGSGPVQVRRRMRLRAELEVAGVQSSLDAIRDASWGIAETPRPTLMGDDSISHMILTPGEVIRRRASSNPDAVGTTAATTAAAASGQATPRTRTRSRSNQASATASQNVGVSLAVAAKSIGMIVDDMDRIRLDDLESEQQRIDDADDVAAGVVRDARDARVAVATLIAKADRSAAACDDPELLGRVALACSKLSRLLDGEEDVGDGAAGASEATADAPALSLAQVLELSMGVRRASIMAPPDELEAPEGASEDEGSDAGQENAPGESGGEAVAESPEAVAEPADADAESPETVAESDQPSAMTSEAIVAEASPEAAADAVLADLAMAIEARPPRQEAQDVAPAQDPDGSRAAVVLEAPVLEPAGPKDPRYEKYERMLKMGVPAAAVDAKMRAEGLDPQDMHPKEPVDPRAVRFQRMLRMGVPEAAVALKMRAEGLDPALLRGAPAGAPTAAKSASRAPVDGPKPSVTTKRLFWDPLDDDAVGSSWWDSCDDASFDAARAVVGSAMAELETEFRTSVEPARPSSTRASDATRATPSSDVAALQPKRAQGVALVLKKIRDLGLADGPVVASALAGSSSDLSFGEDTLELLRRVVLPSKAQDDAAEAAALGDAVANAAGRSLREQEAYVAAFVLGVPRLRSRFDVLLVKFTAPKALAAVGRAVRARLVAVEAIAASESLRHVLRVALLVGNALNHGSSRQAAGVGLSSLAKMSELKGARGHSLLRVVLRAVVDSDMAHAASGLVVELSDVLGAATARADAETEEGLARLDADLGLVRAEAAAGPPDAEALETWADWLSAHVRALYAAREATSRAGADLARDFGERPGRGLGEVFSLLQGFVACWQRELQCVERERLARDRAAQRAARDAARTEQLAAERATREEARARARRRLDAGVAPPTASALLGTPASDDIDAAGDDIDAVVAAMRARRAAAEGEDRPIPDSDDDDGWDD
ncbi:Nfx1-type zinc finger-containing protein [Aureococcus anophagefferens]|nr:Nfx1-type zinc finger-containing protein [Aureococcus anophagefferens]